MKLFNKLNLTLIAIAILAFGISSANAILPTNENNFVTQETIITADWLNHIQDYIATTTTPFFNILGDTLDDIPDGTTYKLLTATKNGYINQDVTNGSSPTFLTPTISGMVWDGVTLATSSELLALWDTDNLSEGSTNLYWTNDRFDARLGASTSLPQLTTAANLTDIGTISQLDFTNASGTLLTVTTLYGNVTGTASGNDVLGQATSTLASHTTTYNHSNYDTAYGWGDHAGLYDILGQATSTLSSHTTAYNHDNFLTGNETITLSGDVSGSGATSITTTVGDDKILEKHLKAVNSATDEYCLTYESTTGDFEWEECSSGGGSGTVNEGTTGQLAYYSADDTVISGTSTIFVKGSNGYIGINNTDPSSRLTVNGNITMAAGSFYAGGTIYLNNSSIYFGGTGGIRDYSGNEYFSFSSADSAVNQFNITNSATGNNPIFTATGTDANVGLTIDTKGTGLISFYGDYTLPQSDGDANQVLQTNGSGSLSWASVASFSSIAGLNALFTEETVASTTHIWDFSSYTNATAGSGISFAGDSITFAPTEVSACTWGEGDLPTLSQVFNTSAAANPTWTYGNNSAALTNAVLTTTYASGTLMTLSGGLYVGANRWDNGSGAIDGEQIADDTIDADSLDWGAFTDLGDGGAVTWGNLAEGELANSTIVSADIKDDTIDSADYAADSIDNEHINWADIDYLGDEGDVADDSIQADEIDTINCGRSTTWDATNDEIDADAELYTDTKCIYFESPTADDDFKSIWTANGFAATITKMWCESDQTVNLDLQVDDGSPADVNGTDLVCDSTPAEDESMGGDATVADGDRLDLAITSVSGDPTWVSLCFTFTKDD